MEFRYMGFEQQENARTFRFDVVAKGEPMRHVVVIANLAHFLAHRVGIQEGPSLCAQKLATDLENGVEGAHQLTEEDLRAHAAARTLAETRKAESRKAAPRRPVGTPSWENSPWRKSGP
ncbi:MAG TPA: hypothetical protein VE959_11870 [Bryobacteraceae bacterium]|nr:hypothetical protein [Bryobacteraceae bacterium]